MRSGRGVAYIPALVTRLKISRFPFINKKDSNISFGGRLKIRKIPMTALAEGQKTWVKSEQRYSMRERGSAVRLCPPGSLHDQALNEYLS